MKKGSFTAEYKIDGKESDDKSIFRTLFRWLFIILIILIPILLGLGIYYLGEADTKSAPKWRGFIPAINLLVPNHALQWVIQYVPTYDKYWPFVQSENNIENNEGNNDEVENENEESENLSGKEALDSLGRFFSFWEPDEGEDDTEYLGKRAKMDEGRAKNSLIKSKIDNNSYLVAEGVPDRQRAADSLAEVVKRAQTVLGKISKTLDGGKTINFKGKDITKNMKTLIGKHFGKPIPLSEYHNSSNQTLGANTGKGKKIEMCVRSKKKPSKFTAINTLFRVHLHELAHSADDLYRKDGKENHGPQFERLHSYLLNVATELNLYSCEEFQNSKQICCDLRIDENYCG